MPTPSDEELLAYVDGRLAGRRRRRLEQELARSWELRVRLEDLHRDIETYVRAVREHPAPAFPDVETAWGSLLERLRAAEERPSGEEVHNCWKRRAAAGLAAALALLALIRLGTPRQISADVILERASLTEQERLRQADQPVIHERFRITRTTSAGGREAAEYWEVWTGPARREVKQRVQEATGTAAAAEPSGAASREPLTCELHRVLERNGLDALRPLAPSGYAAWLRQVRPSSVEVRREAMAGGEEVYVLSAHLAGGERLGMVSRSQYVVRAKGWYPAEHRLEVQGPDGAVRYQIARLEFEVLNYGSLPAGFFHGPERPAREARAIKPAPAAEAPLEALRIHEAIPEPRRAHEVVRALFAAHQQGLCTRLAPEHGTHAADIPAWLSGGLRSAPSEAEREALELSAVSLLETLRADGRAIEALVNDVPEKDLAGLDQVLADLWTRMIKEHLTAVERNADRLRQLLEADRSPHAPEPPGDKQEPSQTSAWRSELLKLTAELRRFPGERIASGRSSAEDIAAAAGEAHRLGQHAGALARAASAAVAELRTPHAPRAHLRDLH